MTSTPGTVLAILTADCLPVLLCSTDGDEVGAAHAGWRGLAAGVLEATVQAMRAPPERVMAWLGPAAGPDDYEIGVEVYDAFVSKDWRAGAAFTCTRPDHWRVDLYALARMRLQQAGVPAHAIHGGGLSTIADPARFFSHRRDAAHRPHGQPGLVAAAVAPSARAEHALRATAPPSPDCGRPAHLPPRTSPRFDGVIRITVHHPPASRPARPLPDHP